MSLRLSHILSSYFARSPSYHLRSLRHVPVRCFAKFTSSEETVSHICACLIPGRAALITIHPSPSQSSVTCILLSSEAHAPAYAYAYAHAHASVVLVLVLVAAFMTFPVVVLMLMLSLWPLLSRGTRVLLLTLTCSCFEGEYLVARRSARASIPHVHEPFPTVSADELSASTPLEVTSPPIRMPDWLPEVEINDGRGSRTYSGQLTPATGR